MVVVVAADEEEAAFAGVDLVEEVVVDGDLVVEVLRRLAWEEVDLHMVVVVVVVVVVTGRQVNMDLLGEKEKEKNSKGRSVTQSA